MGNFFGWFLEHDCDGLARGQESFMHIQVGMDVHLPLKRKKRLQFSSENIGYVFFKYECLIFFFYSKLGHNDSFCEDRMALGYEVAKMGWDLSIRAQSKRAMAINSIWLRDFGKSTQRGDPSTVWRVGRRDE